MDWFETLTGFREKAVDDVRAEFNIDGEYLVSASNSRRMRVGRFETPTLAELRDRMPAATGEPTVVREVVGDVQTFHVSRANAGALFQVASQFNTLEMVSPTVSPEAGVGIYGGDQTQGPACAIACGAGTIWRNYFAEVDGSRGQAHDRQINTLADVGAALGAEIHMQNGYALPGEQELRRACRTLVEQAAAERTAVGARLRVGMQWETEVTIHDVGHTVTQAYCSAVPVGYSQHSADDWEPLARLVLAAAYDATLTAARINANATGNRTVFLTLLGGGVFDNRFEWIAHAISAAVETHADAGLDIAIVSHAAPDDRLRPLLA